MGWENYLKEDFYTEFDLKLMQEMRNTGVVVGACPWDRNRLKEILEKKNLKILKETSDVNQTLEFINKFSDIEFVLSELELKGGDGLELAGTLINRYKMNTAIASRLLRHSSDMLLKELATMGIRLVSPIPVTRREIEMFIQAIKNVSYTKTSTRICLLYTSPSPRDRTRSRMPSSA